MLYKILAKATEQNESRRSRPKLRFWRGVDTFAVKPRTLYSSRRNTLIMFRGQRFQLDLGSDDEDGELQTSGPAPFSFVGDIQERKPTAAVAPIAPAPKKAGKAGFPSHKKRPLHSRFKREQTQDAGTDYVDPSDELSSKSRNLPPSAGVVPNVIHTEHDSSWEDKEKAKIDEENNQRLNDMSLEEIEQERQELLDTLDPALAQALLSRSSASKGNKSSSNAKDGSPPHSSSDKMYRVAQDQQGDLSKTFNTSFMRHLGQTSGHDYGSNETDLRIFDESVDRSLKSSTTKKTVSFATDAAKESEPGAGQLHQGVPQRERDQPSDTSFQTPVEARNADDLSNSPRDPVLEELPIHDSMHFPHAPQPPDLDPSSDSFLDKLHEKYFPSLPAEPEKLEWMTSTSKNDYDASASALDPKDLRFSFSGQLLPPRVASEIPVTAGLHHHGDAPDAAGYTIPELAHLMRSTYAAQRCIAFQTLGRILFRLGKGEFGDPGEPGMNTVGAEDTLGELARCLWREMEKERVVDGLIAESEGNGVDGGRHMSAKAFATEAVWLWRKGGGRRWKAD